MPIRTTATVFQSLPALSPHAGTVPACDSEQGRVCWVESNALSGVKKYENFTAQY